MTAQAAHALELGEEHAEGTEPQGERNALGGQAAPGAALSHGKLDLQGSTRNRTGLLRGDTIIMETSSAATLM